jgi:hypothetical protein
LNPAIGSRVSPINEAYQDEQLRFGKSRTTAVKLMDSDTAMDELMRAPCLRHQAWKQRRRAFSIKAALASTAIVRAGVAGLTLIGTFVATTIPIVSICESFVSILARSRRLQAKLMIRQYQHLIAKECFQSDSRIFEHVQ